jgi:hypothetical protein
MKGTGAIAQIADEMPKMTLQSGLETLGLGEQTKGMRP